MNKDRAAMRRPQETPGESAAPPPMQPPPAAPSTDPPAQASPEQARGRRAESDLQSEARSPLQEPIEDPEIAAALSAETARSQGASFRRGATVAVVLLVVAYGAMSQFAGTGRIEQAWARLEWHYLTLPLLATFMSYVTMSLSYEGIVRAAGANIGSRDM